ncbi:aldehyde dehydrogenase family protein [Novosphingobium bradum]|uniref:Aldehyde dehydrogenase family protein n=1 Tax=Novosphingobium bradum TaxID=1737444 RepID=A0ABV7IL32_9SPHN
MTVHDSQFRADYARLFIDGAFVAPAAGTEEAITPITGKAIGSAPVGTAAEAERALAAAHRSFEDGVWANADRKLRSAAIRRLLDMVQARREEIVRLMMLEMGYTRMECEGQLLLGTDQLEKIIALSARDPMKTLPLISTPSWDGTTRLGGAVTARDPIGVVSCITPYNAGFLLGLIKSAPAIAAGNSMVLKPAPITPLQSLLLAEMMAELDLPPGVFNLVTGGPEVGTALSADARVSMISFTGSDKVGSMIMAQAAPYLIKCHLELGGKSALIIRHDADIARALPSALFSNFAQSGQGCACTTRVLVDNRIRADFVAALKGAVAQWQQGDPFEPGVVMGPLIRDVACQRAEQFVARALEEGASLVHGGARSTGLAPHLAGGFYFQPTIFDNVGANSHLGQNEVFGPVMAIMGFDSDEEAIRIANSTQFGLGGAIISADAGKAMDMALRIRTGMVQLNGGSGRLHPDMPFGGYKRSGLGREWGEEGYNEYTQIKSISFPVG